MLTVALWFFLDCWQAYSYDIRRVRAEIWRAATGQGGAA